MSFMEPQVTDKQKWLEIDGTHGITYIPLADLAQNRKDFLLLVPDAQLATVQAYYLGTPESVEIIQGFGARLSAPGYTDCTEWEVFDTKAEAEEFLEEMYGDDDDEEIPITDEQYQATARTLYADEGELEFDDVPVVSRSEKGAYVQCWRWVSDSDVTEESA